jgi:dipeptidyl aminopeptidase/acylaminoacyl peptidase
MDNHSHAPWVGALLNRRRFLTRAAALGASLPLIRFGLPAALAADEPQLVARRMFFDNADFGSVRISPDGKHLAYLAPIDGVRNLWVAPVDDPRAGQPVTRVKDRNLSGDIRWAHNNRQVVFFQERDGDENWRASSVDFTTGAVVPLTPPSGVRAAIQESDYRQPDEMLIRHNARDKRYFDLFRVNLVTGASTQIFENRAYGEFITDGLFRLRLVLRMESNGNVDSFEYRPDGTLSHFTTVPIGDLNGTEMLDFDEMGTTLYMIDTRGRDKAALLAIDMATGQSTVLAEDPDVDISRVAFHPKTRKPLAVLAVKARAQWKAIDPAGTAELARLADYSPGDPRFEARSIDNRKITVFFERDDVSGEFALLDQESGAVTPLMKQKAALDGIGLRPMQPVTIPARDGLPLQCYLTEPAGTKPSAGWPLVLFIHGGPYLRDYWGYSSTHQWLANRGYGVLSVNYRGSTGFGKAFVTAADREWGGKMHDDLVDGVHWAIAQALADPKRVGFYGGSYGGYSALIAATKTPELFACIVDIFGISNLETFMATIPPYWKPWEPIWKNRVGDPGTEEGRALLRERSPVRHLDRATKPILIAQGDQDVRVVKAESDQMVEALKKQGAPVTYISFSDEGHGFARPENRMAFFAVMEAFLAKHLGGRAEPFGKDFAGSTMKIHTGAELIPGLRG